MCLQHPKQSKSFAFYLDMFSEVHIPPLFSILFLESSRWDKAFLKFPGIHCPISLWCQSCRCQPLLVFVASLVVFCHVGPNGACSIYINFRNRQNFRIRCGFPFLPFTSWVNFRQICNLIFFSFKNVIEVQLTHSVVLVPGVQQSESVIHTQVVILFQIVFFLWVITEY